MEIEKRVIWLGSSYADLIAFPVSRFRQPGGGLRSWFGAAGSRATRLEADVRGEKRSQQTSHLDLAVARKRCATIRRGS